MESVGIESRRQNRRFVLFTSTSSVVLALLLMQIPFVNNLENRVYDSSFGLVHWYAGRLDASPAIGFVSIDDKTVDPDYSLLSTPYGRDGWLTRSLWNMHLR